MKPYTPAEAVRHRNKGIGRVADRPGQWGPASDEGRAARLEEVLQGVVHRLIPRGEVQLSVLDLPEGGYLVTLKQGTDLKQIRVWLDLAEIILETDDPGVKRVVDRLVQDWLSF